MLQDLPDVVNQMAASADIKVMAHDFFQPQPIPEARVYFLHSILHDWPDGQIKDMLSNLVPVLRRRYSKILINEAATRAVRPTQMSTSVDMVMMSLFAGCERTEEDFDKLFKSVGLRLTKVWESPVGRQSLLEVDLA